MPVPQIVRLKALVSTELDIMTLCQHYTLICGDCSWLIVTMW